MRRKTHIETHLPLLRQKHTEKLLTAAQPQNTSSMQILLKVAHRKIAAKKNEGGRRWKILQRNKKVDWEDEQEKGAWKRKDLEGENEIQDWTEKGHKSNKDRVMERNTGEDREEKRPEEEVWEKHRENEQGRREPERRSDGKRKETKVGRREGVCVWVSLSQQGVRLRNIMEKRWMERERHTQLSQMLRKSRA